MDAQPAARSTLPNPDTLSMTVKAPFWFALAALLSACSHDIGLMKMDEQVSAYGSAIRWGQFKKALGYLDPPPARSPDWKTLSQTQMTAYTTQFRDTLPSGKVMLQTVEIRYIPPGSVVEKSFIDQQRWRYDDDAERWVLETGLPSLD